MSCHRKSCESIMCDTYVYGVGYICSSCQSEFKQYLKSKNKELCSEREMKNLLEDFMDTEKGIFEEGPMLDADSFFKNYTN